MFWGIEARYYAEVFFYVTWAFCIMLCLGYMQSPNNKKLLTQNSPLPALVLAVVLTIFLGMRPDRWWWFGDSYLYAHSYNNIATASNEFVFDTHSEWFMAGLQSFCKYLGFNVHIYFLIIETFYIMLMWLACQILLWENTWMAMLFMVSSFSFYSFAVNGIRTGMASSMVLLGFALMSRKSKAGLVPAVGLFILAFGTHRSMMLPIAMAFASMYVIKKPLHTIYIWLGCIALSLVAGSSVQNLIIGYIGGEDNRMSSYSTNTYNVQFAHTGFRWDFLLYSAVPVALTYYMVVKRAINDRVFNFLASTYILSNAVWVLVIRMAFTNRFAFLSWFMYPLVLGYALIRVHIWEDQDKKAAYFLLGHTAFTIVMYMLGKI